MKAIHRSRSCLCILLAIFAGASLGTVTRNAGGADAAPLAIHVVEAVRYVPRERSTGGVATSPNVVRSLDIDVTNISQSLVEVEIVCAIYDIDAKGKLKPVQIAGATGQKSKVVLSLLPHETKVIRTETVPTPAELGNNFQKAKDTGSRVLPADRWTVNWYRTHPYWNGGWVRRGHGTWVWVPARRWPATEAPTPPEPVGGGPREPTNFKKKDMTTTGLERYYGYSVAAYIDGKLVAHVSSNPSNLKGFGVMHIPDQPPPKDKPAQNKPAQNKPAPKKTK